MRFARQASIFRGPVDPAPVVGVLFLLVIFMLLGSLLYTPGVLVGFEGSDAPGAQTITVTSGDEIIFAGKTNKASELDQLRAGDLKNAPGGQPFRLQVEPGADARLVEQVRGLFQVQLPTNDIINLTGTDNPTIVVAVNFRGQFFFENRPVQEPELKDELRRRLQETSRASKKLTLVLWADKAAENEVLMRLYRLARDVGITEILLAEQPSVFGAPSARSRP
jgi:biopolymer transport protein ExbD